MTAVLSLAELGGSAYLAPEELPDSHLTVRNFQEALTAVTPQVVDFDPILEDAESGSHEKTVTQFCVEGVKGALSVCGEEGLYVGSDDLSTDIAGLNDVMISRTSIGETSAHQVFFASLTDGQRGLRVAVKPFVIDPLKSINEWSNTLIARRRGLETFFPIGFVLHDSTGYSLSVRQDGIEPMDNADWTAALANPDSNQEMLMDLKKLGPAIARLHERGCYHGDVQLKNAVITERGSVHVIDWEAANFIDRRNSSNRQPEFVYKKTLRDMIVLFGSLARSVQQQGVGLLSGLTPVAQWSFFRDLILSPYIDERLQLAQSSSRPEVADAILLQLGSLEDELKLYILNGELKRSMNRAR